jgi:hypothetical protein
MMNTVIVQRIPAGMCTCHLCNQPFITTRSAGDKDVCADCSVAKEPSGLIHPVTIGPKAATAYAYAIRPRKGRRSYTGGKRGIKRYFDAPTKRAKKYGMTLKQMDALFRQNDFRCHRCNDGLTAFTTEIDHDHLCCSSIPTCGKCTRGALCSCCNKLLSGEWCASNPEDQYLVAYKNRRAESDS